MAAYNYYGQSFGSPYSTAFPSGYQSPMLPQQMPTQAPQMQNGMIWISGIQEAAAFPIVPNAAVVLWDKSGKTVYLKQADATGKPTMHVYDLVERVDTTVNQEPNIPAYATKDELGKVVGVVKGFDDVLGSIKSDIETMKSDLYGAVGRKKPTVKKGDGEDDA